MEDNNTNINPDKFWQYWLNSTTEFLFFKDLNGVYRGVSKATAKLAGFDDASEMVGKTDFEVYPQKNAESFVAQDKQALEEKQPITVGDWVIHPEQGVIYIETVKSPMYDENGEIVGIQGISRNVTEKHYLQEETKEQKSLLTAIFDNVPIALWLKDKRGRYIIVNKEYEEFYNVKAEDLRDKDVRQTLLENNLASKEVVEQILEIDKSIIETRSVVQSEVTMNIKGDEKIVNIIRLPILREDNTIIGLLGISEDVTDQRNYEKLLKKSKQMAEEANNAKSTFLANMSHEIRTPMNGILGFIQLLADTDLTAEQRDFVEEAQKSSEILLALLNDILDLSKIEAGKISMENISFNVRYVLEDVGTLASSNAAIKGLEINVLCHSDIPEKVMGDPSRLKQVLNNFVNNAIKFTSEGEINLTVSLLEKFDNKVKLLFEIEDTGIGIPEESQAKIFESFTQADSSTTRKYGGTGLGLTISKNIIHMLNGEVKVESEVNVGSKFSFTAEFEVDKTIDETFEQKKLSIAGTKILIVDDNKTNIKVVEHYLKEFKCETMHAADAIEALQILKEHQDKPFELILTDYCMPNINGIDFAVMAKKLDNYKDIPVILLTSRVQISDCKKAIENNLDGYLPKPLRKNDLIECIMLIVNKGKIPERFGSMVTKHTITEIRRDARIKILLVEDNALNQRLATKMLSKAGYTCDIANNGDEAIKATLENNYDLIFMDCQMPVKDGYEATMEIRKFNNRKKDIPIVALTANTMSEDVKKCFDCGMTDYLAKPLNYEHLLEKINIYSQQTFSKQTEENEETSENLINTEHISDIISAICSDLGLDENDAKELLDEFFVDTNKTVLELEESIKAKDYEQSRELAHSIKGASGNLRITSIYERTKEIEARAKNKDLTGTLEIVAEIKNICEQLNN